MVEILRPTLLLDKNTCLQNIEHMVEKASQNKLHFRPHFKTHQSAKIGNWFKIYGVEAITVSSVRMAEYFAVNGWSDITIAFPVNILELENINRLAASIKINLLVESKETILALGKKLTNKVGVFLKIDTGYYRTGIPSGRFNLMESYIELFSNYETLVFKGFLSHTGHTYKTNTSYEIHSHHFDALLKMKAIKQRFKKVCPTLIVSIGDTPSCTLSDNFRGVDEIRPGNFVFYDLMQHKLGVCSLDDIAVKLACPVVAKHPSRNEVVIYGGAIHLSKEYITNIDGKKMFGRIIIRQNGERILLDELNYVSALSQEHGILKVMRKDLKYFNVGDIIEIIPVHSCLTANLMRKYMTTDGEEITMMNC